MITRNFTISMDENSFDNADVILSEIGVDIQTYLKMSLLKLIKERRIPFELSASQTILDNQPNYTLPPSTKDIIDQDIVVNRKVTREMNKITNKMCDSLWDEFMRRYSSNDKNYKEAAKLISNQTGMNRGSAFIYFNIIDNLIHGVQNTRALKFEDLEFFVEKIKAEFPEKVLISVIASLEVSIPYWDEKLPGSFANKVRRLVAKMHDFFRDTGK